jgi:NTE family protein
MMDASVGSEPMETPCEKPTQKVKTEPLNLALQGGGAHGAFTWGVLDRLLEDDPPHRI